MISRSLSDQVASCNISPCVFSDHDVVDLDLPLNNAPRRRSEVWKFNSSLLSDLDFKQLITNEIEACKLEVNNFTSLGDWWDDLKIRIRTLSIDFSVCKHKKSNAEHSSLSKQLIRVKNPLHSGDHRTAPDIKNLGSALSTLISREAEGAKIRSRAQWLEEGNPRVFSFGWNRSMLRRIFLNLLLKPGLKIFTVGLTVYFS